MARPWRDVIGDHGWRVAVTNCQMSKNSKADAANRTKMAQLKGLVKTRYTDPEIFQDVIGEKIHQYHVIKKDDIKLIEDRIKMLEELSKMAFDYLSTFKIDINEAAKRSVEKSKWTNRYESGKSTDETVDRVILSLARRSLRKADYLRQLKAYYSKGGAGFQYRDPQALLKYLKEPQKKTNDLIGLSPGVRMEQLDFVHRGDFETDDEASLSTGAAFHQWIKDPHRGNTPFFLWLENHPMCLEDDKGKLETHGVAYIRADKKEGTNSLFKLQVVFANNPLQSMDMTIPNAPIGTCDTGSYQAERRKDPRGDQGWGKGVAAFVWTKEGELFIAQHMAQDFHHSSFVSGEAVKCAGMIVIENGIVTAISNNSGHYKPRKDLILNFVRFLKGNGTLSNNAVLEIHMGNKKCYYGTPTQFERDYNQLENLAKTLALG